MARRPGKFFREMEDIGAKTISVDRRLGLGSHFYDLSSVGFHARATSDAYIGKMVVVGDWHRYGLEGVEEALSHGLLIGGRTRWMQKRVVCLDYGLDGTHVLVDHACWDRFAARVHTVGGDMRLIEVGAFYFDAHVGAEALASSTQRDPN